MIGIALLISWLAMFAIGAVRLFRKIQERKATQSLKRGVSPERF